MESGRQPYAKLRCAAWDSSVRFKLASILQLNKFHLQVEAVVARNRQDFGNQQNDRVTGWHGTGSVEEQILKMEKTEKETAYRLQPRCVAKRKTNFTIHTSLIITQHNRWPNFHSVTTLWTYFHYWHLVVCVCTCQLVGKYFWIWRTARFSFPIN